MPKSVAKFLKAVELPIKFGFTVYARPDLGEISWSWQDQTKQFWEDWIPTAKDLVIHTQLSKADEQLVRECFWENMEDEIRAKKDSLNYRARQRRARQKVAANQEPRPTS